jgi:threonine/homoserine/homoserine lactone efflux protein
MPLGQLVFYGAWMMLIELFWFSLVVLVLTLPAITARFQLASHWLDRILGGLLVVLGINLLLGIAGYS